MQEFRFLFNFYQLFSSFQFLISFMLDSPHKEQHCFQTAAAICQTWMRGNFCLRLIATPPHVDNVVAERTNLMLSQTSELKKRSVFFRRGGGDKFVTVVYVHIIVCTFSVSSPSQVGFMSSLIVKYWVTQLQCAVISLRLSVTIQSCSRLMKQNSDELKECQLREKSIHPYTILKTQ